MRCGPCQWNILLALSLLALAPAAAAEPLQLQLRQQVETSEGSGRYHRLVHPESWDPAETAVIVCDVWDLHHCLNAVRRAEQFAPRLNQVLVEARQRGAVIIHAPSDCMPAYADHPARQRALQTPQAAQLPPDIRSWCSRIEAEERGVYPIDQSDGGEDDDPEEHAQWAARLEALGRNPKAPWKKQSELIVIDDQQDYISDRGDEVWSILEQRGIKNVILTGVHTNMCVLGRPFGLRQMAKNGKHVVLMRDMTDTMYNPQRWPYVSHFTGTDLIIAHIERFVCPTITSDQLLGGEPFRFPDDRRPHVAVVMAEDEYETERTLAKLAATSLGKDFRVSYVFGSEQQRNEIPGLEVLDEADIALLSIRRRVLPPEQMAIVKRFVEQGKPVIGIRTASHAFALRGQSPPAGYSAWPQFDAQVFGGNYHNHYGNELKPVMRVAAAAQDHPLLTGIKQAEFVSGGSLYRTSPLAEGTTLLITGQIEGRPEEPAAWTFDRADGGKSFYTSLGHKEDFENGSFVRLLLNSLYWAAGLPVPEQIASASSRADYQRQWNFLPVPGAWQEKSQGVLQDYDGPAWYRCAVRLPQSWKAEPVTLTLGADDQRRQVWWNGRPLAPEPAAANRTAVAPELLSATEIHLIAVRVEGEDGQGGLHETPVLSSGANTLRLEGRWQFRIGDDPSWSNLPLPAQFGASPDILFEP